MTLFKWFTRTLWALVPTAGVAALAIPAAHAERGYWAVGGEWLLIVCVFISVMYALCERSK